MPQHVRCSNEMPLLLHVTLATISSISWVRAIILTKYKTEDYQLQHVLPVNEISIKIQVLIQMMTD